LALFHWSYLNWDYNQAVLNSWGANLTDTVKLKLGYRFVLQQGSYSSVVQPGGQLSVTLTIKNEGWAAPFNPHPVELILRETTSSERHTFPLSADPRFWLPDASYSISQAITLPTNLALGAYELLLNLPDPVSQLQARPEYSIRLANSGLWEPATGYNKLLHTLTVKSLFLTFLPMITNQ
jgi:hypothetical protein